MKTIAVSVTNDLVTDQRVKKVCQSLSKQGYTVVLIGRKLKYSLPIDRAYKTKRFLLPFNKGFLFYATYNVRLFFTLLFFKKDILLANDLDTLPANFLVSKLQGKKLVFDSHELFSEIPELIDKPIVKNFWLRIEKTIIPKLKNCYTVCDSIANYYEKLYNTPFKVIRNLPISKENTITKFSFSTNKKIILYQGAVNIGRGLELMIHTMKYLNNHLLVIIGDGDIASKLQKQVATENMTSKVVFLGRIAPEKLQKLTPNAHVGISLEEDLGLNYRYALPNKIFDYIQSEVPVLVSDLPEMKQVVLTYKVGEVVKNRNPKLLAMQIEQIIKTDYKKALQKAKKELIWATEEKKLYTVFKKLHSD